MIKHTVTRALLALLFFSFTAPAVAQRRLNPDWDTRVIPRISRFYTSGMTTMYVSATGSDTNGDGLSTASAYKSVGRALKDIPERWTSDVVIQMGAGTYSDQQNWILSVSPGLKDPSSTTTGTVLVIGNSTPDITVATTGAGSGVAGKIAQFDFNLGTYGATITDTSHWFRRQTAPTALPTAQTIRASTTPNVRLIVFSGTALTGDVTINPFTTLITGAMRVDGGPGETLTGVPVMTVMGLKATSTIHQWKNVQIACHITGAATSTLRNANLIAGSYITSTTSTSFNASRPMTITGAHIVNTLNLIAPQVSVSTNVFSGATTNGGARIVAGHSPGIQSAARSPVFFSLQNTDFEGTGTAMRIWSNSAVTNSSTGNDVTFALTSGAVADVRYGGMILLGGNGAYTGTVDTGTTIRNGGIVMGQGDSGNRWSVTNTAIAGQDFLIGPAATVRTSGTEYTDATDLSMYRNTQ